MHSLSESLAIATSTRTLTERPINWFWDWVESRAKAWWERRRARLADLEQGVVQTGVVDRAHSEGEHEGNPIFNEADFVDSRFGDLEAQVWG